MKRLNLYSAHIKQKYGQRVQKIPVDAGFTCPNRDGSKGLGGCTFCNNDSFSSGNKLLTVGEQITRGIEFYRRRNPELEKFIVYFQSYSNTYRPVRELERIYGEALEVKGVVGMAIGTRPDCVDIEKIKLLSDLAKNFDVTIEYGLESFHEETLQRINRGHGVKEFYRALEMTAGQGISICTHLMLGFPWENEHHLVATASQLEKLEIDYIKIHQLQLVKQTVMARDYQQSPYLLPNKEQYFLMLKKLITHLPPRVVIQRLFSDYSSKYLIFEAWPESLAQLTHQFIQFLEQDNSFQGSALLKK